MKVPKLPNFNPLILPIILIAVVGYLIWKNGKKAGLTVIPDVPYIQDQEQITKFFNPNPLADELFNVMDGLFTLTGTKDTAWRKLLELGTDNMVISVYNAFNTKYGFKGKGTLTAWIKDETYYDFASGIRTKVLARLDRLRLQ